MAQSIFSVLIASFLVFFAVAKPSHSAPTASAEPECSFQSSLVVAQSTSDQNRATLRPAEPLSRAIAGGETHTLILPMTVGQYAVVEIEWDRIDLDVRVLKPDREAKLFDSAIQVRGGGALPISIVADVDGAYQLQVRTVENVKISGNYKATLTTLRPASAQDSDRFRGLQQLTAGESATAPALRIERFEEALQSWRQPEDASYEAYTLRLLGRECLASSRARAPEPKCSDHPPEAKYRSAMEKLRESQPRRFAFLLMDIAGDYSRFGSRQKAIDYYQQALSKFRASENRWGEASALYQIGINLARSGNLTEAIKYYDQALLIQRAEHNRLGEARTLNAAGGANHDLGRLSENLELLEQARPIWLELNDAYRGAITEYNVGLIHHDLGNFQAASEKYSTALIAFGSRLKELIKDSGSKEVTKADDYDCTKASNQSVEDICSYIADARDNLGELDCSLNDPDAALLKFNESLPVRRALKRPLGLGFTLSSMAYAYLLKGDANEALKLTHEALPNTDLADDKRRKAITLTFEGMAYTALNQPEQALSTLEMALKIQKEIGERRGEAITLDKMGNTYALLRNHDLAEQYFNLAISNWQQVLDQDGETISRYNLARLKQDKGDLSGARQQIGRALSIIESKRTGLTDQSLRTTYFAGKVDCYALDIDLKMRMKTSADASEQDAAAFESSEKAHARALLDSLIEGRVDREFGGATQSNREFLDLITRQQETELKLATKLRERSIVSSANLKAEQAKTGNDQIKALAEQAKELETKIARLNPRYAALVNPPPPSLRQIQEQLDGDTILLEYSLSDPRSYVWAVSPDSIKGFELPPRKEIETVALKVIQALTERNRTVKNETVKQWRQRLLQAEDDYRTASAALGEMVLDRVAGLLENKRLVIVADGALQQVSFAALPAPRGALSKLSSSVRIPVRQYENVNSVVRLLDTNEIVYEPSASVFALQKRELARRPSAPYALAVLANPVFDKDDKRVRDAMAHAKDPRAPIDSKRTELTVTEATNAARSLTRALEDVGLNKFSPLPNSKREAAAIVKAAGSSRSKVAVDFDANRATAMSAELAKYRIIHFATHSVADFARPELSGIVLSMVDEKGQPQDGYLRLHDIYNLSLPADLVVLSACQTGVGKEIRGEGLIALTRGFMYAGAQRVVASLWKVDDAATAELMAEFYNQMFTKGLRPAAALRVAQTKLSHSPGWREPYYWAGFVLQGDWK